MFSIFSKLLDSNEKQIKDLQKTVDQITSLDDSKNSLESIKKRFEKIREKAQKELKDVLSLDKFEESNVKEIKARLADILPEVYSLVRSAGELSVKHRHYDVQLMAGTALFHGRLVELGTGEGKTLVATLPLSLYAILGLGNYIVTVNDYLAKRDGEWCGHIYDVLGLTTGIVTHEGSYRFVKDVKEIKTAEEIKVNAGIIPKLNQMHGYNLVECTKAEAYACDIVYCTNNELGFDYLRDNMVLSLKDMAQRRFLFCIVDEADSILIDESRTPLIISTGAEKSNDLYSKFANVVRSLKKDKDYSVDEKQRKVILTDEGVDKVEKMIGVKNIWQDFLIAHHLENALSAKELFKNEAEYIVKDGEVLIVDEFTGRLMQGRRFSEGIHQAIEAKEGVDIKEESRTMAQVTFQNLFRLFPILGGMTGTALTEAEEFSKIYNLEVVVIPPNKKNIRDDKNDVIFKTEIAKFNAVVEEIKEKHEKGQPVLVGSISVERSEVISSMLQKIGLKHQVLNAKYHEKEAEIISHAGEKGQITISTNMAGRGTDIMLGNGVQDLGGLAVIGTERHESRRIDNQLRGRSGRQGDPGETRFYVSLEDNLMRIFGGEKVASIMTTLKFDESIPLEFGIFSRQIESAQKKVESMNFDYRKHLVEYDDVLNVQREIVYKRRRNILNLFSTTDSSKDEEKRKYILDKINKEIEKVIDKYSNDGEINESDFENTLKAVEEIIPNELLTKVFEKIETTKEEWLKLVYGGKKSVVSDKLKEQYSFITEEVYDLIKETLPPETFNEKNKRDLLRVIDVLWVDHLDVIEAQKEASGLTSYSQKDPLIEYKNAAYLLFEALIDNIEFQTARSIFKYDFAGDVRVSIPEEKLITNIDQIENGLNEQKAFEEDKKELSSRTYRTGPVKTVKNTDKKIGRNDLCHCGSGKKYKKCHGKGK